ncbi:MAG TPA: type IV secretory system conjugative DNA transfer family protein, partial [Actinomycetota bacterium]|nr:type IV secretory system conjugative DNA transfer family protein [Actinomycetota bacterium]
FRRRRVHRGAERVRSRRLGRRFLLSVPELAQIATLPSAGAIPGLERAGARTVPPPRGLPTEGKVLGDSDHPGIRRRVAIAVPDARHHLHVIGETGTGKSTLLASLALQDAEARRSTVVIDPKGDLVEAILERLPKDAEERTCLIDPDDRGRAVGLNVLAGDDPDLVVDHVAAVFKRIYEHWWGPRTDDIMRAACLTLHQIPGTTLAEVPLLLTHLEWRRAIQERLTDVAGVRAFWRWYDRLQEGQRAQHIAPLLNKLRAFLLRGPVRAVVGQAKPRLDIGALLDAGGLLLVRIPKGTIGEDTSRLLGAFVIARVWQACMRRAARPEVDRPDTALYVDEMHNYLVLPRSFEDLLAEARGYRLSLVLAHQHMGQLPREMRDALGANARTKVVFTCSPEDAYGLARHFSPELNEHDLSHLTTYQAACRPTIAGGLGHAFTFRTLPLGPESTGRASAVRERSAELFAADRWAVEGEIRNRHLRIEQLLPRETSAPLPEEPGRQSVGQSIGRSVGQSVGQS